MLKSAFFNRDAVLLAKALLGKVLRVKYEDMWLSMMIIETEAYYLHEKGSHASLGFTQKRKALFMPAGTIYMYYSRGEDSLNISAKGEGNAVLIKSGVPYIDSMASENMIAVMQKLNPIKYSGAKRDPLKLGSGQTLLCRSLGLKVKDWDQKNFKYDCFYLEDVGYHPKKIIQAVRLGIPLGRDEHLLYRFIDYDYSHLCTDNPLTKKKWIQNSDYFILKMDA